MVKASRTASSKPKRRSLSRFVAGAVRGARRAGEVVDRVEIDPVSGKIAVILTKEDTAADKNTWDEVLTDAAHKERPA